MSTENKVRAQTGCVLGNKCLTQFCWGLLHNEELVSVTCLDVQEEPTGHRQSEVKPSELGTDEKENGAMPCKTLWLPLPHIRMWQCCTLHCLAFPCPLKQRATDNLEAAAMRKTLEMFGH